MKRILGAILLSILPASLYADGASNTPARLRVEQIDGSTFSYPVKIRFQSMNVSGATVTVTDLTGGGGGGGALKFYTPNNQFVNTPSSVNVDNSNLIQYAGTSDTGTLSIPITASGTLGGLTIRGILTSTNVINTPDIANLHAATGTIYTVINATWTNLDGKITSVNTSTGNLFTAIGSTWTNLDGRITSVNASTANIYTAIGSTWTALAGRIDSLNSSTATIIGLIKATATELTLWQSSTASSAHVINQSSNPVHWNALQGVPAGFADGSDDGGAAVETDPSFLAFATTGQAMIEAGAGFNLFKTTGQAQISAAGGFTLAQSTINSRLNALDTIQSQHNVIISSNISAASITGLHLRQSVVRGSHTAFADDLVTIGSFTVENLTSTGPAVVGDLTAWTTAYTPFEFPFAVLFATAVGRSTATFGPSHLMLEANISTSGSAGAFVIQVPPGLDSSFDPTLVYAITASTGVDPSSHAFSISVASVGVPNPNSPGINTMVWQSSYVVQTTTITGGASNTKMTQVTYTLPSWRLVAGNGGKTLYIRLNAIDLGYPGCQRWFGGAMIAWRRRT